MGHLLSFIFGPVSERFKIRFGLRRIKASLTVNRCKFTLTSMQLFSNIVFLSEELNFWASICQKNVCVFAVLGRIAVDFTANCLVVDLIFVQTVSFHSMEHLKTILSQSILHV